MQLIFLILYPGFIVAKYNDKCNANFYVARRCPAGFSSLIEKLKFPGPLWGVGILNDKIKVGSIVKFRVFPSPYGELVF